MSEITTAATETDPEGVQTVDTPEAAGPPAPEVPETPDTGPGPDTDAETFPREVVEKLRQENSRYRQRAQHADTLAARLHTELVRSTGRLADPSDLPFDEAHLDDPEALAAAVDELLAAKPHLANRRPVGDIGQGNRGGTGEPFSLLGRLKNLV